MKKQSAEDYLDKLLNSVNGDEEVSPFDIEDETALDMETIETEEVEPVRVSRRVSKSEEDFLREFEAELEADDFDDFLKNFDDDASFLDDEATCQDDEFESVDLHTQEVPTAPMDLLFS